MGIVKQSWIKDGYDLSMDSSGVITLNETSRVKFDEVLIDGTVAIVEADFFKGKRHRTNKALFLNGEINSHPIDEENGSVWEFNLTYTSEGTNLTAGGSGNSQYRPEINTGSWSYTEIVESDKVTNAAIINPANDPYDPQPETTVTAPVLFITLIEKSAHIDRLEQVGSINQSSITIAGVSFPKYTAMFAEYSSDSFRDEKGFLNFKNTFAVKGKFKKAKDGKTTIGFQLELLAAGFNQIDGDGNKAEITVKTPKDPDDLNKGYDDVPVATPQMLDANGQQTETPFYQLFTVNNVEDFNQFNLPTSYPVY